MGGGGAHIHIWGANAPSATPESSHCFSSLHAKQEREAILILTKMNQEINFTANVLLAISIYTVNNKYTCRQASLIFGMA